MKLISLFLIWYWITGCLLLGIQTVVNIKPPEYRMFNAEQVIYVVTWPKLIGAELAYKTHHE